MRKLKDPNKNSRKLRMSMKISQNLDRKTKGRERGSKRPAASDCKTCGNL